MNVARKSTLPVVLFGWLVIRAATPRNPPVSINRPILDDSLTR